jgi:hypothetical protein
VSHLLEFLEDRLDPAGADQQDAVGQSADDVVGELLAGEEFLRQEGVLGLDEAHPAVQLHRDAGTGARSEGFQERILSGG